MPYLLYDRTSITPEGITAKLEEYSNMENDTFQFLNEAVEMLTIGIENMVSNCSTCSSEIKTEFRFPNGASSIFIIHGAFDKFIKK